MERVRDALASRDTANLERLAHTLRTNCGMLGAMRMAGAFAQMEEAAGRNDLATAAGAMEEAERQLPVVLEALSEL
jgi:HPt (histidine-containing phosphotransfer) domain-containing protein